MGRFLTAVYALLVLVLAAPCQVYAQFGPITVNGTVIDQDQIPLAGVVITLKGSKNVTTTDVNGKYRISFSAKDGTLVFQYLGMKEESFKVSKSQVLDVTMKSDNTLEESVIVAGYGLAQKRSDMTGSAFQIEAKQLETLPAARIDNLLDGMVPGLTVDQSNNGTSRASYKIRVRGDASLSANSEMTREYRRDHKEEYIPLLKRNSPHVWSIPGCSRFKGKKISVRYSDAHMSFKTRIRVR